MIILVDLTSFGTTAGDKILSVYLLSKLWIILEDFFDFLILGLTSVGVEMHYYFIEIFTSFQGLLFLQLRDLFLLLIFQCCEFLHPGLNSLLDHLLLLEFQLSAVMFTLDFLLELQEVIREILMLKRSLKG